MAYVPDERLERVHPPTGLVDPGRIVRISTWAALAIVGRVAFLWAPNVALTYVIVFTAGVLEGALAGAVVGLLAMTVTNLALSGLHPVLVANGIAMAVLGLAGGWARGFLLAAPRDRLDRAVRLTTLVAVGFFATLVFSIAADLVGYVLQFVVTPEGRALGVRPLGAMVLAGLVFNLVPALINGALFATVVPAVVHARTRGGRAPAQGRDDPAAASAAPAAR